MKKFSKFIPEEYLAEKLILFNNGARFGQVVFMVGGTGTGKSFSFAQFMEVDKFKYFDADSWSEALPVLYSKLMRQGVPDAQNPFTPAKGLNVSNPADTLKLHGIRADMDLKNKFRNALMADADPRYLPNLAIEMIGHSAEQYDDWTEKLSAAGYEPKNIHIVWCLSDYTISLASNAMRNRKVPDNVVLSTAGMSAKEMYSIITNSMPAHMNGAIKVIWNGMHNTIFYPFEDGTDVRMSPFTGKEHPIIVKDFLYLTFKDEGKPVRPFTDVQEQILRFYERHKTLLPKNNLTIDQIKASKPLDLLSRSFPPGWNSGT